MDPDSFTLAAGILCLYAYRCSQQHTADPDSLTIALITLFCLYSSPCSQQLIADPGSLTIALITLLCLYASRCCQQHIADPDVNPQWQTRQRPFPLAVSYFLLAFLDRLSIRFNPSGRNSNRYTKYTAHGDSE